MLNEPPSFATGEPESENDCASTGEVVVYQPERTHVNLFVSCPYRIPNGGVISTLGIWQKPFRT
jgi:hypothetical protein